MTKRNKANLVDVHIPCPCGESSDAYCTYDDGTDFCYSCWKAPRATQKEDYMTEEVTYTPEDFRPYPHRGLTTRSLDKYGVLTRFDGDRPVEVGFPYPGQGNFKIRGVNEKKFTTKGNLRGPQLFGADVFEKGGDVIFLTEGEYDAISCYQVTGQPSLSVKSANTAKKDVQEHWDFVNSFKTIVLAFDNDDPGQKASREVASLFNFNKVLRADFTKYNDPNDYLQNDEATELIAILKRAKKYTPENIISSFREIEESLAEGREQLQGTYPFEGLQNALHGLHKAEVVVFKGDEGIGKTEVFRAMENHLLKEDENNRIGILHLEEDKATTIKGIANYHSEYPFLHPNTATNEKEIMDAYKSAVHNRDDRVFIYESFDVEDDTALLDNIRFLVSACGCNFIFLDHISWLATGQEQQEDERRKLDRISQKLKYLAKELDFTIVMISHTNDDGKTRGSRNITKVANTVVHMSRDKVNPIEQLRTRTSFMVEKARIAGGQTGPAGYAQYDVETCMLKEPEAMS